MSDPRYEVQRVKRDPKRKEREQPSAAPVKQPKQPTVKEIEVEPSQASTGSMRRRLGAFLKANYRWLARREREDVEQTLELVLAMHGNRSDEDSYRQARRDLAKELYRLAKSSGMRSTGRGGWMTREVSGDCPDLAYAYQSATNGTWG